MAQRLEEEIAIARSPSRGDQVPFLEEKSNFEEAPVNPPPLTVGDIKVSLIQFAQVVTTLAQAMTAQANREVVVTTRLVVLSSRLYFWKNWQKRQTPRWTVVGTTDHRRISLQNT